MNTQSTSQPLIKWQGGKRKLAKQIIPLLPAHTCYIETFCGGAAILFKRPVRARVEVINDINGDLVNLYRVVQNHKDEFLKQFEWLPVSRQLFQQWQTVAADCLTDIQRAARFYYTAQLAFGGRLVKPSFGYGTTSAPRYSKQDLLEKLEGAHKRLERVTIENLPWQECVARYDRPHSFFYLDPPYWQTTGYGVPFEWHEFEAIAERMRTMQGTAMLSINDHPDIRRLFADFYIKSAQTTYSTGKCGNKKAQELIITNYAPDLLTKTQILPLKPV